MSLRLPSAALVAVLGVLLTGLLLALTRPTTAAPGSVTGPALRQVEGPGGSFMVGERWSDTPPTSVLWYADATGRPVAGLAGAQVADVGWCAGWPASQRGFAGLAPLAPGGDVGALVRRVAAGWARGITARAPPDVALQRMRLADGMPALRARLRLRAAAADGPCGARRVRLDVVGFVSARGLSTFVLVRDVDPAGVGDAEAEEVVQSLRSRT